MLALFNKQKHEENYNYLQVGIARIIISSCHRDGENTKYQLRYTCIYMQALPTKVQSNSCCRHHAKIEAATSQSTRQLQPMQTLISKTQKFLLPVTKPRLPPAKTQVVVADSAKYKEKVRRPLAKAIAIVAVNAGSSAASSQSISRCHSQCQT